MDLGKYSHRLSNGLVVQSTKPEHAKQLDALQQIVFPTLAESEQLKAAHYLRHIEVFPEGQFVIVDTDKVVGATTTMRSTFDFANVHHTFAETIAGGWLSNHNPHGDWLYGLDMGILPQYRGMGLARALYQARHQVAAQLHLKGQLTVGMMSGYGAVMDELSAETYYNELLTGQRTDPTISAQMKIGFEPIALMTEYLNDPVCGNYGVLLTLDIDKWV